MIVCSLFLALLFSVGIELNDILRDPAIVTSSLALCLINVFVDIRQGIIAYAADSLHVLRVRLTSLCNAFSFQGLQLEFEEGRLIFDLLVSPLVDDFLHQQQLGVLESWLFKQGQLLSAL